MIRVMILFGGRSGEHEVSLASARAIMKALQKSTRYEVTPVGITRSGRWLSSEDPLRELEADKGGSGKVTHSTPHAPVRERIPASINNVDVVFPVLHGPYGEDGTIQGMLELAGVPYVGSGVLASAAGMDKITMKKIFAYHGLPQVKFLGLSRAEWKSGEKRWLREIEDSLGYPCFVKPSNLGSSVGISKAGDRKELGEAIELAAAHDRRIIVERGVEAREIEVSVLGNETPEVSLPGEIFVNSTSFYDYAAKYTEGGMKLRVPAAVQEEVVSEIRRVAGEAYRALDAAGMARMDFFLEHNTNRLLLNEINTIPGFTPTSVYARLWDASGLSYERLLDRLIELALERHMATAQEA